MRTQSSNFLRYCERLYEEADRPITSSALWHGLEMPTSTVHEWIRRLRFHRVIASTEGGYHVDRVRLLDYLTALRRASMVPLTEGVSLEDARTLSLRMTAEGIDHALCMQTAANEWAFFEPQRRIQVYVGRSEAPRLQPMVARERPVRGRDPYRVEVFRENLGELNVVSRNGLPVTSLFVTVLDCRAHPEGGAHAHFLERMLLQRATA